MDTTVLETAVRNAGVLPSAIEDAVRRLEGHFAAQAAPTPEMVNAQLLALRATVKHLFPSEATATGVPPGVPSEVWKGLSPSTRLAWAREHGYGLTPVQRRPRPLTLSAEQTAELAAMSPQARLAAYRELQAQQQP